MVTLMGKRKPKRTEQTDFGRVLDSLMALKGVRSQQRLADILGEVGHPISQAMVSYYMGEATPPARFVVKVSEGLWLDDLQKRQLARAWRDSLSTEEREALATVWELSSEELGAADLEAYEQWRRKQGGEDDIGGSSPN